MSNTDPTGQCILEPIEFVLCAELLFAAIVAIGGTIAVNASQQAFTQLNDGRPPVLSFPLPEEPNPWSQPGTSIGDTCVYLRLIFVLSPVLGNLLRSGFPLDGPILPPAIIDPLPEAQGPVVFDATYGQARQALRRGDTVVDVGSRRDAANLLGEFYAGYRDITDENPVLIKDALGSLAKTYHWDDKLYGTDVVLPKDRAGNDMFVYNGRLAYHDLEDVHSRRRHLQIRDGQDRTIRIFWGAYLW